MQKVREEDSNEEEKDQLTTKKALELDDERVVEGIQEIQ